MSILLNLRVYQQQGNEAYIGLAHFETNSRIVFRCEHDGSRKDDPWGVAPIEVLGTAFSYFGQFGQLDKLSPEDAIAHQQANPALVLDDYAFKNMSDIAKEKLTSFSSALSVFLNNAGSGAHDSGKPMKIEDMSSLIEDKVVLVQPISPADMGRDTVVPGVVLSVTNIKQRDLTVHMAKLDPVFNQNISRSYVDGQGAEGVIDDVLAHVGESSGSH